MLSHNIVLYFLTVSRMELTSRKMDASLSTETEALMEATKLLSRK